MKKQQVLLHKGEAMQISNEHRLLNNAMRLKNHLLERHKSKTTTGGLFTFEVSSEISD